MGGVAGGGRTARLLPRLFLWPREKGLAFLTQPKESGRQTTDGVARFKAGSPVVSREGQRQTDTPVHDLFLAELGTGPQRLNRPG